MLEEGAVDPMEMNIAAYGHIREHLELQHRGDWVVLHQEKLAGIYSSYEEAHRKAMGHFDRSPYLIAEVGGEWINRRVKEVRAKAARWLADAGGSEPQIEDISRRRSEEYAEHLAEQHRRQWEGMARFREFERGLNEAQQELSQRERYLLFLKHESHLTEEGRKLYLQFLEYERPYKDQYQEWPDDSD